MRRKEFGRNDRDTEWYKARSRLIKKKATKRGTRYSKEEVAKITKKVHYRYVHTAAELALELGRTHTSIEQVRRRYG